MLSFSGTFDLVMARFADRNECSQILSSKNPRTIVAMVNLRRPIVASNTFALAS